MTEIDPAVLIRSDYLARYGTPVEQRTKRVACGITCWRWMSRGRIDLQTPCLRCFSLRWPKRRPQAFPRRCRQRRR